MAFEPFIFSINMNKAKTKKKYTHTSNTITLKLSTPFAPANAFLSRWQAELVRLKIHRLGNSIFSNKLYPPRTQRVYSRVFRASRPYLIDHFLYRRASCPRWQGRLVAGWAKIITIWHGKPDPKSDHGACVCVCVCR